MPGRRTFGVLCAVAAGVLLIGGCSSGASGGGAASSSNAAAAATSTGATSGPVKGQVTVQLASMPTGTATLTWDPKSKIVTAVIDMYGFTPNSRHAMHIHPGTCAHQDQPPSVGFPDIAANAAGDVQQTVRSAPVDGGIPTNAYLNIHLASSDKLGKPTDVGSTPIACGDISPGTQSTGPVALQMTTPVVAGQTPRGTATLDYDSDRDTLTVDMKVSGLAPDTTHAVHIHSGSCAKQGDVVYPLNEIKADNSGAADTTTTVKNVSSPPPGSGWYINVHFGAADQILSGKQPTMFFAPILCGDIKK